MAKSSSASKTKKASHFQNVTSIPSVMDLYKQTQQRKEAQTTIYAEILKLCCKKIDITNRYKKKTHCRYSIPHLLYGAPTFDKVECIAYMTKLLKEKGFKVKNILRTSENDPFRIYISWKIK